MSGAPQPRMHALTHVHGGPDPAMIAWEDVGGGGSGGGGGGIQMDTANTGDWLGIETYNQLELKSVDYSISFVGPDFSFTGAPGPSNPAATNVDFTVNVGGGINLQGGGGNQISVHYTGGIQLSAPTQDIGIWPGSGRLTIYGLPTTNPGGSNLVWRDAGVLKIT